ncbi:MAG: creatininase family protein [candidate division Zixibacteria bacterium]|nr:creatininase family protein [candidate division Zixibacteria bacterium]
MAIFKLEELNYKQIQDLSPERTLFLIVVSPLEEHAPHLPVGTDVFIADYFAGQCAMRLSETRPEWNVVHVGPLYLGAHVFKFTGSVRHSRKAVYDVLLGYGKAIAEWGFKYVALISAHGGAGHISVLEEAAAKISRKHKIRAISLTGVIAINFLQGKYLEKVQGALYRRLEGKDLHHLQYDYHAGWWETSMMLMLKPELVKQDYKEFPPVLLKNPLHLRGNSALKMGQGLGYFGTPSFADLKLGEASSKVLIQEGMKILNRFLDGEDVRKETQSVLYRSMLLRVSLNKYIWGLVVIITVILALVLSRAF